MICPLFTEQISGRDIIMRYSYEFKIKCVKMYERETSMNLGKIVFIKKLN